MCVAFSFPLFVAPDSARTITIDSEQVVCCSLILAHELFSVKYFNTYNP